MGLFAKLSKLITIILRNLCPPIHAAIYSKYEERRHLKRALGFFGGFLMGQVYYYYLLRSIPFPPLGGLILRLTISLLLAIGNAISIQVRCISLLTLPMYFGKAGRGVLKAIVLTYVLAGPITNMGMNAKEVVRVFACSTQLSYNLSKTKYSLMARPFKNAIFGLSSEIGEIKDTLRSVRDIAAPIEAEVEGTDEIDQSIEENDYIDDKLGDSHRSADIEKKYAPKDSDEEKDFYEKQYLKKMEYRCEDQLSRGAAACMEGFASAYDKCYEKMPWYAAWLLCWPMKLTFVCNIMHVIGGNKICDSRHQIDPGLGEGYVYFKKGKNELTKNFQDVRLQYKITNVRELVDIQDAKETSERVMHSFEEKNIIMKSAQNFINICMALLFLRIIISSQDYHDKYLTLIEFDNVYITQYFKTLDERRLLNRKPYLLPLKKMEKSKYIDIHSVTYVAAERHKFFIQVLKLLLEVVTATTFIMLDRLFYEALDVVRVHADVEVVQKGAHDLEVDVEGTGMVAGMVRKVLTGLNTKARVFRNVTNTHCLPQPRLMPYIYFVKIYGGYLWILLLLYFNAYTLRLRRLIASYFYPRREKQRILHLYNDILKKRMKMSKTLKRKAIQAVRAYYLSGDDMLSLTLKFPKLLGWLRIFPAARKKCLICGETEPRTLKSWREQNWHSCPAPKCPFVYCPNCWIDIGGKCLACDPALGDVSDIDSLSEEERFS